MNRRRLISLLCAASFAAGLGFGPHPARADENAIAIVTMFYKVSAGKDGKYSGNSAYYQDKIRARYFSRALRAAADALDKKAKKENGVGLDFDPVTDSQDPSVKDLKIAQDGESDGESAVKASFSYEKGGALKFVRYVFLRQNDAWKLDNMTSGPGEDGWDLRKLIKDELAAPAN